tara:strand:- start:1876 stop:2835 length:960 start_codon:yes stop_codon:yes gene_type:complete
LKKIRLLKIKIIKDLQKIIDENKFVHDVWIYGSFKDSTSDLDLILIYKKKPPKINFPVYIKKLIDDGNIIYIERLNKKKIFLFEQLKIYSVIKRKYITKILNNSDKKNRDLTSFIERYYYSRLFLDQNNKIDNIQFRKIKSLLLSYKNFFKIQLKKDMFKKFKNIEKRYYELRREYNLVKLKKKKYIFFLNNLKNFDYFFSDNAYFYLEKKFPDIKLSKHTLKFTNNIIFNYKKKDKVKIPKLFFMLYFFYASQKLSLSKKIFFSFNRKFICSNKDLNKFFSKSFKNYLLKKIIFLNFDYLNLKRYKFKGGLYRFGWYL